MNYQHLTDLFYNWFSKPDTSQAGKLYFTALTKLGQDASPLDEAPDMLGCVDSVEEIYKTAFGEYIGGKKTLSTIILNQKLAINSKWQRCDKPERGAVIVAVTEGKVNGHTGICGDCNMIMSNDSKSGLFLENYSYRSWLLYFQNKLGLKINIYKLKG